VREPIQVYLTRGERATLDRVARELGVSRAEVLRRGVAALAAQQGKTFHEVFDAFIKSVPDVDSPPDLAENHDEYLARDIEERMDRYFRRSS
jgi:hypothetical protein